VVSSLISKDEDFINNLRSEYEQVRLAHSTKKPKEYLTLAEARANAFKPSWNEDMIYTPAFTGIKLLEDYSLAELRKYIDWTFFFLAWEFEGKYPDILTNPEKGEAARKLFDDANAFLDEIIEKKMIRANGVFGIWPANSVGDDIELYENEERGKVLTVFHHLRQQHKRIPGQPNYCLSDFVAPKSSGIHDYCGGFAVTAGIGVAELVTKYKKEGNDYYAILLESLADRLAEAFAERLHERVRKEFWAYAPDENLSVNELIRSRYQGIRPAPGYPSCPDHTEKQILFDLLSATSKTGISLTEHFSMSPTASVCGQYFAHKDSVYFPIEKIAKDQVIDYARRKGAPVEYVEKFLSSNLNY